MKYRTLSVVACSLAVGFGLLAHAQPSSRIAQDQARALEALRQAERAQPSRRDAESKKKPSRKHTKQSAPLAQRPVVFPAFSLEDQDLALRALRRVEHGQPATPVAPYPSSPADYARALEALRRAEMNPALARKPNRAAEIPARNEEQARRARQAAEREARRAADEKARADKERAAAEARQRAEQERNQAAARLKQAEQEKIAAKSSESAAATRRNAQKEGGAHIELHREMRLAHPPAAAAAKPSESAAAAKRRKAQEEAAARLEKLHKGMRLAKPAAAPAALSIKEQKLADLLRRYEADEITPLQYHTARARILAEP
jgi:hypothetical protein